MRYEPVPFEFTFPFSVDFGPNGIMAVTDLTNHNVHVFRADGMSSVYRVGADTVGDVGSGPGEFNGPAGVAFGPNGTIAVVDRNNHRIQVFRADGMFGFQIANWTLGDDLHGHNPPDSAAPGGFDSPYGIDFGPNGTMAVADRDNHRIQVFRADGTFDFEFGSLGAGPGNFSRPYDVAFGPNGTMAVADRDNHRIQVFRADGTFDFEF